MNFIEKTYGTPPSADGREVCPWCKWPMNNVYDNRFECAKCNMIWYKINGKFVPKSELEKQSPLPRYCEFCQKPMRDVSITMPWEDGGNSYAYIRCSECGAKNTLYGFGEDD